MRFHGVLVEVEGLGVLLAGPSGSGKSECALELVARGHRFVADDAVELAREDARLVGRACAAIGPHVQIRGLGILSVAELYGERAVTASCPVDLLCRLVSAPCGEPDETGLDSAWETILGVSVRRVELALPRAASLATLVEVAARDQRWRQRGDSAAARFEAALLEKTRTSS